MDSWTLNFTAETLSKDTSVLFVFSPPADDSLFKDQFPVVWKVVKFHAGHGAKATVRFDYRLAFGAATIDDDGMLDTFAWIEAQAGDVVHFGGHTEKFSTVSKSRRQDIICRNNTSGRANLVLGALSGKGEKESFHPLFLWTNVGHNSIAAAKFAPTVSAHIIHIHNESQILRREVETEAIMTIHLDSYVENTNWGLVENEETGEFNFYSC
ncbi:hypothetical protein RhiJN_26724 [Ceratobasidium sp. AG-Ba]|nr:hypothetical protein RhiJN_12675 [Ceratobasidium sp. AG-Ba]QRV98705.1 hypothetical protein RhiJN_26724 [Ceratobasidium sp. AG-Ba]